MDDENKTANQQIIENFDIPRSILEAANSGDYEKEYHLFSEWGDREQVQSPEETILLAYFVKLCG